MNRQKRDDLEWTWWDVRVGRKIEVKLVAGWSLTGVLKFVATFSLCLDVGGHEVLIMKNAVASAEIWNKPAKESERPPAESRPKPKPKAAREAVNLDHLF